MEVVLEGTRQQQEKAVNFIHPGIAMAAGGIALAPLLIHLLSRQGYRREPWAAMQFLVAAERKSRKRLRFEQWLLILLRAGVVLLAGLTIARPFVYGGSFFDSLGASRSERVIVIDDSLSMQARHSDGSTSFERAKEFASRLVKDVDARDGIALVRGGRPAQSLVDRPTRDRQIVERVLGDWTCSPGMNDLVKGVEAASEMLARGDGPTGEGICYVITDFTRSAIGDAPSSMADMKQEHIDRLVFIDVGPEQRDNVAVTDLRLVSQLVGVGIPARFAVEVSNAGLSVVSRAEVQITVDGAPLRAVAIGPIAPGEASQSEFEVAFARAGSHRLRAKLKSTGIDVLAEDNERFLAVEVSSGLSVLAVQDGVGTSRDYRGLFYYAAAISAEGARQAGTGIQLREVTQARLDQEALDDHDVIVLSDPRNVSRERMTRLEKYVRSGGGLIVLMGKGADPSVFSSADGAKGGGLLPVVIDGVVQFDEKAGLPRFEIVDSRGAVTADFGGNESGGLQRAFVRACWGSEPAPQASGVKTHLRLTSGQAIAVSHEVGRGRVVVWLTSADMSWTNLPAKPDFVPLMLNLTMYAAGNRLAERNILAREVLQTRYPARAARDVAGITDPAGTKVRSELYSDVDGSWLRIEGLETPGFYSIQVGEDRRDVAVNLDTADRDLSKANAEAIQRVFGKNVTIIEEPSAALDRRTTSGAREFAQTLMICLMGLVIVETMVGAWFGGRR